MGGCDNTRAVSEVMGAILVFSLLVTALGAYQAVIVPNQNEDIEFKHNQEVQEDFIDLRNSIHQSSTAGEDTSVSVDLGVRYPSRALTLNPPEQGGSLEVNSPGGSNLAIKNAKAEDDEVADHWHPTFVSKDFSTGVLVYTPSYNLYQDAPTTTVDNSVIFNHFPKNDETIAVSGQRVVDGRKISLVSLEGDLSKSQVETSTVDVRAVSTGDTQVSLTDTGSNIEVTVPTTLDEEVWVQQLLATEIDDADGEANGAALEGSELCSDLDPSEFASSNDRFVVDCEYNSLTGDFNTLTLVLEKDQTYSVDLSQVAVESKVSSPEAQYVVPVEGDDTTITSSQKQELTAQVRDRFDNPVSGKTVTFEIQGLTPSGTLTSGTQIGTTVTATTDENGLASVKYDPAGSNNINVDIEATTSVSGSPSTTEADRESAEFAVSVGNPNPNNPIVGSNINPSGPLVLSDSGFFGSCNSMGGGSGDCFVNLQIRNDDSTDTLEIKELRFNVFVGQEPGASSAGTLPDEMKVCDSDDSDSKVFARQGAYQDFFSSSISPAGGTETYTVKFSEGSDQYDRILEGDYFVVSVTFGPAGTSTKTGTATYFIAPTDSPSSISNTNNC